MISGNGTSNGDRLNESYGIGAHDISLTGFTVINNSEVSEVFWNKYSYIALGY